MDVALPSGTTDERYMQELRMVLPKLLASVRPQLVLYNAGVDVHAEDSLGLMHLTNDGILERDRFVFEACGAAGAPVAAAIGGGYQQDHTHIVERHVLLHRAAAEYFPQLSAACSLAGRAAAVAAAEGPVTMH
jgi:acetoin utilization deacetylase AcuC-like enzyme